GVCPMRGRRMIRPKQVISCRKPLVEVLLHDRYRNFAAPKDAREPSMAGEHVKEFFLEHRRDAFSQWRKTGMRKHRQLIFAVPIEKLSIGKKMEPVVDGRVDGAEQAIAAKSPPLKQLPRLELSRIAKIIDQQVAHLPAVTHFLAVHTGQRLAIVFRRRRID